MPSRPWRSLANPVSWTGFARVPRRKMCGWIFSVACPARRDPASLQAPRGGGCPFNFALARVLGLAETLAACVGGIIAAPFDAA